MKKLTKIARKRLENPTSYNREIDTTMKASNHSEVRFFTKRMKNLTLWSKEMRISLNGWFAWKP
jgi:thiamine biosynthesis lipoprotein ApbE